MPARHVVLDPLVDRHLVELLPARRVRVVVRRVARSRDVRVDLLPDHLQVVGHLRERVRLAEEVAELLGALRLGLEQVVERQPELLRELLDRDVVRVDQLAAVLVDLAVGEVAAAGPAAAADPVRSLVDLCRVPRLLQAIGGGQPGETGADDDDPRRGERRGPQPAGRRSRAARRLRAPSLLRPAAGAASCGLPRRRSSRPPLLRRSPVACAPSLPLPGSMLTH